MIRTWTPESETPPTPPGKADYRTVKAWFQQCRDMTAAVEAQRQKIQRIRDVSEKTTPSMSGMPGGGGSGDKVGFAVEQMDAEERTLLAMQCRLKELREEAVRRLYRYPLTSREYSTSTAAYACDYYINCAGTDARGNFKLKTYEMTAAELHVDVSTVKKAVRAVMDTLYLHQADFDYSTMIPPKVHHRSLVNPLSNP